MTNETREGKAMRDFGFLNSLQRRGLVKWILLVLVSSNAFLFKTYRDANIEHDKVFHEMIRLQMHTQNKVDSSIHKL